jgi:hypothetical protein
MVMFASHGYDPSIRTVSHPSIAPAGMRAARKVLVRGTYATWARTRRSSTYVPPVDVRVHARGIVPVQGQGRRVRRGCVGVGMPGRERQRTGARPVSRCPARPGTPGGCCQCQMTTPCTLTRIPDYGRGGRDPIDPAVPTHAHDDFWFHPVHAAMVLVAGWLQVQASCSCMGGKVRWCVSPKRATAPSMLAIYRPVVSISLHASHRAHA